jgi:hypothetical protein
MERKGGPVREAAKIGRFTAGWKARERRKGQLSFEALVAFSMLLAALFLFISLEMQVVEKARSEVGLSSAKSGAQHAAAYVDLFALDAKHGSFTGEPDYLGAGNRVLVQKGNSTAGAEIIANATGRAVSSGGELLEPA